MGFYDRCVVPHLINLSMRTKRLAPYRVAAAGAATGRVLEIGLGSGLNLPFYGPAVTALVGVEPSAEGRRLARRRIMGAGFPVEVRDASAESLPFEDGDFDTVVTTFTLCTIPDAARALAEARRVLKPAGALLFAEHGRSPDARVVAWQDRLNPLWRRCAGGCNINRAIDALIAGAGFRIDGLETGYLPGPRVLSYVFRGQASPG